MEDAIGRQICQEGIARRATSSYKEWIPWENGHEDPRSRVAVTDSAGQFTLRRLLAGSYLMQIRRLGFQPIEGALTVDTGLVREDFTMQVTSRLLSKVVVKESSVDVVKRQLDRVGYIQRSRL